MHQPQNFINCMMLFLLDMGGGVCVYRTWHMKMFNVLNMALEHAHAGQELQVMFSANFRKVKNEE